MPESTPSQTTSSQVSFSIGNDGSADVTVTQSRGNYSASNTSHNSSGQTTTVVSSFGGQLVSSTTTETSASDAAAISSALKEMSEAVSNITFSPNGGHSNSAPSEPEESSPAPTQSYGDGSCGGYPPS